MMKKMLMTIVAGLAAITAGQAYAGVTNIRPVTGDLSSVQAAMDAVANDNDYDFDAVNDQLSAAIWEPTSGAVATTYVATISWGFLDQTSVGLYAFGDPSKKVDILNPVSGYAEGDQVIIQFLANGTVRTIDLQTFTLIDQEANFGKPFGLFMHVEGEGATTWYTEDELNDGQAQILAYESSGEAVTIGGNSFSSDEFHHYFAFEGLSNDGQAEFGEGNIDFNDLILQLESVRPVPAPGALALAALGLPVIGWVRRRLS